MPPRKWRTTTRQAASRDRLGKDVDYGGGTDLLVGLLIYFLPTIVGRRKRNAGAIFVLNLLLGWTLIGWVVALVWALTYEERK